VGRERGRRERDGKENTASIEIIGSFCFLQKISTKDGLRYKTPGGNNPTVSIKNSRACRLNKGPVRKTEGCSTVHEEVGVRRGVLEIFEMGPGQ
jgi:hypothetical protein